MPTLTYGFKTIADGVRGFWDDLNDNFTMLNDHDHDGVNSSKIVPTAITKATQSILAASWSAGTGGNYTQTVTLPTGYTFSAGLSVKFYDATSGSVKDEIAMNPVWISNSSYQLQTNDVALALTAVYA
jgi:hypothetical protein